MHRQTCRILMYFCFQADIPPDSDTRLGLSVRPGGLGDWKPPSGGTRSIVV